MPFVIVGAPEAEARQSAARYIEGAAATLARAPLNGPSRTS